MVTDFCYLQSAICSLCGMWILLYTKLSVVGSLSPLWLWDGDAVC
jgi:hypothetical protein